MFFNIGYFMKILCTLWDIVSANPALDVALVALFYTIFQGWRSHTHNKLSLHPLLRIEKRKKKIKDDDYIYEFEVVNYGTGPAIITSNTLFFNSVKKAHNNSEKYHDCIVQELINKGNVKYEDIKITFLMPTSVIGAGVKKILWSVRYNDKTCDKIIAIVDRLDLRIEYESIYGNKMVPFDTAEYRKLASPDST